MGMDVRGREPYLKVSSDNRDYEALAHAGDYFPHNVWGCAPFA